MYQIFDNYLNVEFNYEKISLDVKKGVSKILNLEQDYTINVILVNDEEIAKINLQYRHQDKPTDVISFVLEDDEDETYLGDIFISIDHVISQATKYGHSIEREFAFLLCHGTLHLFGYDHLTPEDEEEMFALQEQILTEINYRR